MPLENVRYMAGETKNDPNLSKELASLAEIFVNDAFGTAHLGPFFNGRRCRLSACVCAAISLKRNCNYGQGALSTRPAPLWRF